MDGVCKAVLNECVAEAELQKYPKITHLPLCDAGGRPTRPVAACADMTI
jgi:hypothetical protein